ncbi:hypothetical protein DYB34_010086, partial [Aphanomyces astaci]
GVVDPLSGLEDKGTVLQIIIDNDDGHQAYVFFRWGRVGAKNPQVRAPFPINQTLHVILLQRKLHGPFTKDAAKELFVSKFTAKTENDWPVTPPFEPVKGKYTLIGKLSKSHLAKGYVILDFISDTLTTIADLNAASKQVEATSSTPRHRRRSSRVIKSTASSTTKAQLAKCKAQLKDWTSEYIKLTHAPTHRQYKLHVDAVHALHKLEPSHSIEEKDPSLLFDALNNHQNYIREDGVKMPKGTLVPTDAEGGSLLYNEYVVYRTDQVRLRYAVTVTFEFN